MDSFDREEKKDWWCAQGKHVIQIQIMKGAYFTLEIAVSLATEAYVSGLHSFGDSATRFYNRVHLCNLQI